MEAQNERNEKSFFDGYVFDTSVIVVFWTYILQCFGNVLISCSYIRPNSQSLTPFLFQLGSYIRVKSYTCLKHPSGFLYTIITKGR